MTMARLPGVILAAACGAILAAAPEQPTFSTVTHYVTLDVLVTDHDDRPVKGLTRDDFRITERGRPQEIADFTFVEIPVGEVTVDLEGAPATLSDVAVNAESEADSRAIAIVVDDTVLSTDDIVWIKRTLGAMLGTFSTGDHVAFTYVRRSDLGQDFTNDPVQHVRAVNRLTDAMGLPAVSPRDPGRDLLVTLENVVNTLAAARQQRRAIVLVGTRGCLPYGPGIMPPICKGLIDRARERGVPIYAIDPTGNLDVNLSDDDPLQVLAVATGGKRYRESRPWLSPGRVMADNGSYYLLGYYPRPMPTDGKFHDVEVTVNRPGVVVRARRGYTAPWWRTTTTTPQRAMTAALGAGLPDPGLPLRVFVAPLVAGPRGTTRTVVTVEVAYPVPNGGFAGNFTDQWRVGILALDADGKVKASFQRPISFSGTWKPSAMGTFVVHETIDVPTQRLTFRIGVTSQALARTGTAHITVDVPDFRDRDLQLSALVVGTMNDSPDAAIGLDRLRDVVPFQPTTRRVFSRDHAIRVFGRAVWRGPESAIGLTLEIVGSHDVMPLRFSAVGQADPRGHRTAAIDRTLPLVDLTPGAYRLRLTAEVAPGAVVVREIPFRVR